MESKKEVNFLEAKNGITVRNRYYLKGVKLRFRFYHKLHI